MEDHDIDVPPETLLLWIREENKARSSLQLWPAREFLLVPRSPADKGSFGEDDDLGEIVAVGTLDVRPVGGRAPWVLHFRIEDELAAHAPEEGDVPAGPEAIDFESFWSDFVVPARGTVHAWATVDGADAKRAFTRFLRSLEGRHATRH